MLSKKLLMRQKVLNKFLLVVLIMQYSISLDIKSHH